MSVIFRQFAATTSRVMGSPWAFLAAATVILLWALSGPMFGFSDTWQLVINTGTTIVTFLMVFLIQNTQNRDAKALHLKLDELIKGVSGARTGLVGLEELPDEHLDTLQKNFTALREEHGGEVAEVLEEMVGREQERRGDDEDEERQATRAPAGTAAAPSSRA